MVAVIKCKVVEAHGCLVQRGWPPGRGNQGQALLFVQNKGLVLTHVHGGGALTVREGPVEAVEQTGHHQRHQCVGEVGAWAHPSSHPEWHQLEVVVPCERIHLRKLQEPAWLERICILVHASVPASTQNV